MKELTKEFVDCFVLEAMEKRLEPYFSMATKWRDATISQIEGFPLDEIKLSLVANMSDSEVLQSHKFPRVETGKKIAMALLKKGDAEGKAMAAVFFFANGCDSEYLFARTLVKEEATQEDVPWENIVYFEIINTLSQATPDLFYGLLDYYQAKRIHDVQFANKKPQDLFVLSLIAAYLLAL